MVIIICYIAGEIVPLDMHDSSEQCHCGDGCSSRAVAPGLHHSLHSSSTHSQG